jgi:tRNA uridine 5-carbamoylmethylation protein Kti12
MNAILMVLIGLPASGKTTLAHSLCERLSRLSLFSNCISIDPDQYRREVMGEVYLPEKENQVQEEKFNQIRRAINPSTLIIIDDLNYYKSMRHSLFQIAGDAHIPYSSVFLKTNLNFCLENNRNRKRPLSEDLMREISTKLDTPGETYKWDIPSIILNPEKQSLDQMVDQLISLLDSILLKNVGKLKQSSQSGDEVSEQSQFTLEHTLDLKVREIFHRIILHDNTLEEYELITQEISACTKFPLNQKNIAQFFPSIKKKFINWLIFHSIIEPSETNLLEFLKTANGDEGLRN